jgi:hypothetical protein
MMQADELPDHRAYLDGGSTVMAFKSKKYLENLRRVNRGVKINCNFGAMRTDMVGKYGSVTAWFIPEGNRKHSLDEQTQEEILHYIR